MLWHVFRCRPCGVPILLLLLALVSTPLSLNNLNRFAPASFTSRQMPTIAATVRPLGQNNSVPSNGPAFAGTVAPARREFHGPDGWGDYGIFLADSKRLGPQAPLCA